MRRQLTLVLSCCLASLAADSPAPHVLITEPDQGIAAIYGLMRSATRTLDLTMYELADPVAERLLAQAAANHVTVRVILDRNRELHHNQPAFEYLEHNGVQVVWAARQYAATHQKSIVVDGTVALIMTLNFTSRFYSSTRDFAVLNTDPLDIAAIEQVFDADFYDGSTSAPRGTSLVWSPTEASGRLLDLIRSAQTSLLIEAEEMSDSEIVSALASAASAGVRVQVVMTYDKSYARNLTKLAEAGAQVHIYSADAPLYIHAKVILADYGTANAAVFVGSENFSDASLERNRELGLIVSDPAILSSIKRTLTEDFNAATPW
jgi:phosphatidylserine/phosphatidylglycerophosphate/cardiolipin synthase-like enzyme